MTDYLRSTLKTAWIFGAIALLAMPVFIPSFATASSAIEGATLGMFLLSFPSSVIAMPLIFMSNAMLGFHGGSIVGSYMVLVMLSIAGFVQWFWIVPTLLGQGKELQPLDLGGASQNPRLFRQTPEYYSDWFDVGGETPLEQVIHEDRES
jgi:hypothetical protein